MTRARLEVKPFGLTTLLVTAVVSLTSASMAVQNMGARWRDQGPTCTENGRIAFVRDFPRSGRSDIYSIEPDGTGQHRLTWSGDAWSPTWSPDGARIAFEDVRGGDSEIYSADGDGGDLLQITDNTTDEATPAWSPDGDWIAFASDAESEREGSYDIYKMRGDGTEITRLTDSDAQEWTPTWSPDSSRIAFYREDKIIVMEADGSGATRVYVDRQAGSPDWAPSGSRIVFQADHFHTGAFEIHLIRSNGTGGKRLTRRNGEDQAPTFSPNGQRIAYSRDWNLAVMRRDGTKVKTIHRGRGDVYSSSWGPARCALGTREAERRETSPASLSNRF